MVKIYTKTGDRGDTGLWGGKRVPKNHPRVRAYGDADELNSSLGVAIAALPKGKPFDALRTSLRAIQEEIFVLGAILATPADQTDRLTAPFNRGIPETAVARLETEIDRMTRDLAPMKSFILPGGSATGALLHLSRTVCRRAERELVTLREQDQVPETLLIYLNRLSDYLFTAARWVNRKLKKGETPWKGLKET